MTEEEFLEEYFEICKRTFEEMARNDSWPWKIRAPETETVKTECPDSEVQSNSN